MSRLTRRPLRGRSHFLPPPGCPPVPFLARQTLQLFSFLKSNAGNSGPLDFFKQQPQTNENR